jgi:hypothetical protein
MENLKQIRNEMLRLHKTLMEIERANYEAKHGQIANVELLSLLFEDENFIWLREISSLVSEIDELFASKEGIQDEHTEKLFNYASSLFDESEKHLTFKHKYRVNLNTETDVAFHHVKLLKLFAKEKA